MTTCDVSPEEYARVLRQLLPPGPAMQFEDAVVIEKLLLGLADTYAQFHDRTCDLLGEMVPATTNEMLGDWERVAGLPDDCAPAENTIEARRAALVAKIGQIGGQSPGFFVGLAASFGFTIEVETYQPFRVGFSAAGDALTNDNNQVPDYGWQFVWKVKATTSNVFAFRAGIGRAGEPLRAWGNSQLECVLNKWKPAHTMIIFDYGDLEYV